MNAQLVGISAATAEAGGTRPGKLVTTDQASQGMRSRMVEEETLPKKTAVPARKLVQVAEMVERFQKINAASRQPAYKNTTTKPALPNQDMTELEIMNSQEIRNTEATDTANAMDMDKEEGVNICGSSFKVHPKPKPTRKHRLQYNIKLDIPACTQQEYCHQKCQSQC
jgi:hypothetical protein